MHLKAYVGIPGEKVVFGFSNRQGAAASGSRVRGEGSRLRVRLD